MDGALVVDKPAGPTSHDVVARARRALGVRKIGHTGTLDPAATGVLLLLLGSATRLARFMTRDEKGYDAEVRLGVESDTYDATGTPAPPESGDPARRGVTALDLTTEAIEQALAEFRGSYLQTPPPFSAKKVSGERAYHRARRGEPVALQPVEVAVSRLELTARDGDRLRFRLDCSSGFYVRTFAHDLGRVLGCGAWLEELRRVRSGGFTIDAAIALRELEDRPQAARARIIPPRALLPAMPAVVLSVRGMRRARHGQDVGPNDLAIGPGAPGLPAQESSEVIRLLAEDGALVAIAEPRAREGALHPVVVLG